MSVANQYSNTKSGSSSSTKTKTKTNATQKTLAKTVTNDTTNSSSNSVSDSTSSSASSTHGVTRATGQVDANTQEQRAKATQEYQQNANVQAAYEQLQNKLSNEPGAFDSKYKQTLENLYDQIANREKFNYNVNADALYQQYKDLYESQGKKAMEDTMAVNAALTGGYGSSFTQTAGQQAYQNYLEQLNDRIPELRNQAYQEYQNEAENLRNQFSLANSLYGNEYNEYRGNVSDYQADRSFLQGQYQDERNFDYNQYAQNRQFWNDEYWNERNAEHTSDSNTAGTEYTHGTSSTTGTSTTQGTSTTSSKTKSQETTNSKSNSLTNTNSVQNTVTNSSGSGSGGSGRSGGSSGSSDKKAYNDAKRTSASKEGSSLYKSIVNAMAQATTGNLSLKETNDARGHVLENLYKSLSKQGKMSGDDYLYFIEKYNIPLSSLSL